MNKFGDSRQQRYLWANRSGIMAGTTPWEPKA